MMKKLFDAILDTEVTKLYMIFHVWVLVALWGVCLSQLWSRDFGNVLCISAVIIAWKMKGVNE